MSEPDLGRSARIPTELAGERLDRALQRLLAPVPRSRCKTLIQGGHVRVDGEPARKPGQPVAAGQLVEVHQPPPAAPRQASPTQELRVLYEDEHLAVVDKPAGMLVHPSAGAAGGTLSELAVARWGPLPTLQGADRPGIVHRLDAGTSGAIVLGLSARSFGLLMAQFRERTVQKTYLAFVHGEPRFDTGWIEAPIARSEANPTRMEVTAAGEGRDASTFYEVRERLGAFALVAASPRTGRTHQIRVHLTSIGHPLVGDPLYRRRGGQAAPLPPGAPELKRQALHASTLRFTHPATGEELAFEAPLPADLAQLLEALRAASRPA